MRLFQTEYLLKGIFLGLLVDVALIQARSPETNWQNVLLFVGCLLGGLLAALIVAGLMKFREGYRARGKLPLFALFLLLESSQLVYLGVVGGLVAGYFLLRGGSEDPHLASFVAGGAILGLLCGWLREVQSRQARRFLSLALAAALIAAAAYLLGLIEGVDAQLKGLNPITLGVYALIGLPMLYLLTFAGQEEETEVEVGILCALLGVGITLLTQDSPIKNVGFFIPLLIYFWYTIRVLGGLRVTKHVLRGVSHAGVGRYRPALLALRRAIQLDPQHELAREAYWSVHISLDPEKLANDPETLALVDFEVCLDRAGSLLLSQPTPQRLEEAQRLLNLVLSQRQDMLPRVRYWRAVAAAHQRRLDEAATELTAIVATDQNDPTDRQRRSVLMPAWNLALLLHPGLRELVGKPQLALPGRRMEAIAAVERHLAEEPGDQSVWPLKRYLYQDLSEEEFAAACSPGRVPGAFDYQHVKQMGLDLVGDPVRRERGCELLRIAAAGLPEQAPALYVHIAHAYEKAGQTEQVWASYERARQIGRCVGQKNLPEEARQAYFTAVKLLGERALAIDDTDGALENYLLFAEWERSGLETLRTLAGLYEKKGDVLAAARAVDQALVYNPKDPDLLRRKDQYYYSIEPDLLKAKLEQYGPGMDVDYCLKKSKSVLESTQEVDLEMLDWAEHLVNLALVVKPEHRPARVLKARILVRRGEIEEAVKLLDAVRSPKPEKFASTEEEEAWYAACQLLGDLYLNNLSRADLAIPCLMDFRNSPKSGARTLYRLGQAYEQLGDIPRAKRCYEQASAYEGNPIAQEAEEALARLGR